MSRADFRLPDDLKAAVMHEAAEQGLDFSEYVRQTLVIRLAWTAAVRAVQAGGDPAQLLNVEHMQRAFGAIARNDEDPRG